MPWRSVSWPVQLEQYGDLTLTQHHQHEVVSCQAAFGVLVAAILDVAHRRLVAVQLVLRHPRWGAVDVVFGMTSEARR